MRDEKPPSWWPHLERSRFVTLQGQRWHLQQWPARDDAQAPCVLLLHGTGASSHSWRHLAPLLCDRYEVVAPDLPGHGFTRTPVRQDVSLPGVSAAVLELLRHLQRRPALVIGHSAGAAVAARLVLDSDLCPQRVVAINGALLALQGPIGRLFAPTARLLAANPLVAPGFAAWAAWPGTARRLLQGTGSTIDALGERCYRHLIGDARHAGGALRLMAAWDLEALQRDLPGLRVPLQLIVGLADRTLPPSHALRVQALLPDAVVQELPGLGHLAHEEDAPRVAALCLDALPLRGRAGAAGSVRGRSDGSRSGRRLRA